MLGASGEADKWCPAPVDHTNKKCLLQPVEDVAWEGAQARGDRLHSIPPPTPGTLKPQEQPFSEPNNQCKWKANPEHQGQAQKATPTTRNASALATQHTRGFPILRQENRDCGILGCGKHIEYIITGGRKMTWRCGAGGEGGKRQAGGRRKWKRRREEEGKEGCGEGEVEKGRGVTSQRVLSTCRALAK